MAALDKWHYKIEAQLRLEAIFHAAKELMVSLEKNVSLCSSQFNKTLLNYFILANAFDSKLLIRAIQSCQKDTTKASFADLLHQVEIFKRDVIS